MSYGDQMFRGTRAIFVAVATVMLLAGCQSAVVSPASPTRVATASTAVARFSSNAEALTAAKRAYKHYLAITDAIADDGGEGVDRVNNVVTPDVYERELASFSRLKEKRLRVIGNTGILKFIAQSVDLKSGSVSAYACLDLKASRVLNRSGDDVTPKDRPDQYTAIIRFVWQGDRMLLREDNAWSGDSIC